MWSAKDPNTAIKMVKAYASHLEHELSSNQDSVRFLDSLAHTLSNKRTLHTWRVFEVAESIPQLIHLLSTRKVPFQMRSEPKLGFVFTGQGAQWYGMGKELFIYPVFKNSISHADRYLQSLGCTWDITGMYFLTDDTSPLSHDS